MKLVTDTFMIRTSLKTSNILLHTSKLINSNQPNLEQQSDRKEIDDLEMKQHDKANFLGRISDCFLRCFYCTFSP